MSRVQHPALCRREQRREPDPPRIPFRFNGLPPVTALATSDDFRLRHFYGGTAESPAREPVQRARPGMIRFGGLTTEVRPPRCLKRSVPRQVLAGHPQCRGLRTFYIRSKFPLDWIAEPSIATSPTSRESTHPRSTPRALVRSIDIEHADAFGLVIPKQSPIKSEI